MVQRLFVHDMKKWQANCRSHEIDHAQVREYERAIILPLRKKPEFDTRDGVFAGGCCSENFDFIAGRRRRFTSEHANFDVDSAYKVASEDIVYRDETVVFGGCLINHFGHALLDGTARMWYLTDAPDNIKIVFLRYPYESKVPFDALKFVELMGIDMNRVEVIDAPTQFAKVIVPDEAMYPADAYRSEYIRTFDCIRDRIEPKDCRKLYMSRRRFQLRPTLNEEYYESFFERRGYTVIFPETLSIEDQIAYVAGADDIVTSIGSMSHLLLFAKSTVTATILNRSTQCLPGQIIVNQVRGIEPFFVDAFRNPLPVPHVSGPFLFGPNRFFKAYLDERGIAYEDGELHMDAELIRKLNDDFLHMWNEAYADNRSQLSMFKEGTIRFYAEDYAAFASAMVMGKEAKIRRVIAVPKTVEQLNAEVRNRDAEIARLESELRKSRAEVKKLRNSKSWKVTAPLRALMRLFGEN
ncbi:glycosyltransferase family 61 protein [Bifidobacterium leontopitheci]|uniref:Glycosyl transferase family 2 n=1 Tax=Bifidobacterium leontopitheci TaxID=2650774 RepID=A0A6I1GNR3_9BIFI|nr:glycosyltransferase family 61 protein [Bifidobacterium leontopitheci]KAB7789708.1 glycosyl transferase family 2 [Bifidobacterium leontopitheci]